MSAVRASVVAELARTSQANRAWLNWWLRDLDEECRERNLTLTDEQAVGLLRAAVDVMHVLGVKYAPGPALLLLPLDAHVNLADHPHGDVSS